MQLGWISAWGSWARARRRTCAGRPRADGLEPHARRRPTTGRHEHGATVAGSPAEAAAAREVVFTMVVDGAAGRSERARPGAGARGRAASSTCRRSARRDARDRRASLAERGVRFVDAPVTGLLAAAEDGTLTIMAGGETADFARARPLLEVMGELIVHVGPLGHGQAVKLINNAVAAANAADARPGAARRRGRRASTSTRSWRSWRAGSGGQRDARAQGRADARPRLHDAVQDSSTCSRTSACASRRRRPPTCRSRPPPRRADALSAAVGARPRSRRLRGAARGLRSVRRRRL